MGLSLARKGLSQLHPQDCTFSPCCYDHCQPCVREAQIWLNFSQRGAPLAIVWDKILTLQRTERGCQPGKTHMYFSSCTKTATLKAEQGSSTLVSLSLCSRYEITQLHRSTGRPEADTTSACRQARKRKSASRGKYIDILQSDSEQRLISFPRYCFVFFRTGLNDVLGHCSRTSNTAHKRSR